MNKNKRHLSWDITEETKKTRKDSQQDDEVLDDSGYSESQGSDEYPSVASARCRSNTKSQYTENVLCQKVETGSESSLVAIMRVICALLNSGGGVVEFQFSKGLSTKELDELWKKLEDKWLSPIIEPESYSDVFDRYDERLKMGKVLLFIKAPGQWCTLNYNLFLATDAKVSKASRVKIEELLLDTSQEDQENLCKVPIENLRMPNKEFLNGKRLSFPESKHMQFKHFPTNNLLLHKNNRTQREAVVKQISAFGNTSGGIILLGVKDDGTVEGQELSSEGNSKDGVEREIESIIKEMRWPCVCQRYVHWDVKFFPVIGKENWYIIAIYVAGISGGVFIKKPKSFELRREMDGRETVSELTFDEWKEKLLQGTHWRQLERRALRQTIRKMESLSLSEGVLLTVKGSTGTILESFFRVEMGCPVSPKNFEEDLPKEARVVIAKIQELSSSGRARSLLVGSRSWRACLNNKGIDAGESPPLDDGVICDVLLFSSNLEGLHLFTLCNRDEDDEFCRTYNFSTTKALKKALVVQGGCSEKFYITPHVVNCLAPIEQQISLTDSSPYPVGYKMTQHRGKINQILTSLINVLASIPSALSSKMGVKFLHLLTEEQFKLLYEAIDSYPELWIRGMAGTGKTVVAIEFIRKLFERDRSLKKEEVTFVCENVGLKEHVSNHDLCKCYTRKGFMSMPEDLSGKVKHIVMDEVQSFRDEDRRPPERESWLQRARRLVRQHSVDNPGFLWLFNDNHQVNHLYETGIPPVKEQKPFIKLRKVIRNSKRIVQYVADMMAFDEKEATDYVVGHDFEGDDVWMKDYKEGEETPSLKEVIQSLRTEGYCEEDITVLYGKEQLIPKNLGNSLNITTIVGAEKNASKYLVVSTLRKYSGLERPVVILVNLLQIKSLPYRSLLDRAIYCCATRAMVKLVILREMKLGIHQSTV